MMRRVNGIAGPTSFGHGPGDLKVRELRDGVSLRPETNPPVGECLVLVIEEQGAVEVGLDLRSRGGYAKRVPRAELRLRDSRRRDRAALAVHDRVEPEVVLERVGSDEEIVAAVLCAEDDAAARILLARDRAEPHRDVNISESLILEDRDRPRLRLDSL